MLDKKNIVSIPNTCIINLKNWKWVTSVNGGWGWGVNKGKAMIVQSCTSTNDKIFFSIIK